MIRDIVGQVIVALRSGSIIKSIQTGTITITSTNTSNTATINSINTARSVVLYGGTESPSQTDNTHPTLTSRVAITNATTITATRGAPASGTSSTVAFTVIEFWVVG